MLVVFIEKTLIKNREGKIWVKILGVLGKKLGILGLEFWVKNLDFWGKRLQLGLGLRLLNGMPKIAQLVSCFKYINIKCSSLFLKEVLRCD